MMLAVAWASFRRHATYRQATVAAAVTNTVFGCLRVFVLLAVATAGGGGAAGYTTAQLSGYVWVGQGLLGTVALWGWTELADRVRTGEVVTDLLRPINPLWTYLAGDLGRALHAAGTRLLVPIAFGALVFPFHWPRNPAGCPLFVMSCLLAVVVCFMMRYLVNLTAFWLLDSRGVMIVWTLASGVLGGLYFPIDFLPGPIAAVLRYATPFPSILQIPADVLVERGGLGSQLVNIGVQALWVAVGLAAALWVQRAATRKLVIQGG